MGGMTQHTRSSPRLHRCGRVDPGVGEVWLVLRVLNTPERPASHRSEAAASFCDTGFFRIPVFHNVPVLCVLRPVGPVTAAAGANANKTDPRPLALADEPIHCCP